MLASFIQARIFLLTILVSIARGIKGGHGHKSAGRPRIKEPIEKRARAGHRPSVPMLLLQELGDVAFLSCSAPAHAISASYFQNATNVMSYLDGGYCSVCNYAIKNRACNYCNHDVGCTGRPSKMCQLTTVRVLNVVFIPAPIKQVAEKRKVEKSDVCCSNTTLMRNARMEPNNGKISQQLILFKVLYNHSYCSLYSWVT